ncbi:collagen binding domain-containing protein [Rhodococcus sp. NPDC060090]|uniref:MSCRAMM family protein n=1 Tax=Rhodococcus sp. NPDC060090 TaxID=3347056 RepID=UPI00366919F3
MRAPSRILSALVGVTLVVAVAGTAGAEPSETDTAPSVATTTSATTPTTPPPDVGIEMGTVAIRAATLSDDQPIAGVSVAVARCETGELVGTPTTDPDGTASVSASLGCYVASAAGFPDGYDPVSTGPWQVDLTAPGQVRNVGFIFARWTPPGEGTIAVRARHVDAGSPVPGVTSSVRSCVDEVPYGYLTTDMNGNASAQFPLGCYVVTATTTPADTALVYGGPFTAELDAPGVVRTAEFTLNFSLPPEPPEPPAPTAHGRIVKMDRISGEPLEGAVFVVGPCRSEWNHREVTGRDGQIPLALVPGCHVAKEIIAPDGYIADTRPITFEVTEEDFFTVQALNMPEQPGPIFRNPAVRVPIRSIPAGPLERG